MAVRIRLQRRGKKKQPVYRIVVQDSRVARDGNVIDVLGIYNPVKKPTIIEIKQEEATAWLKKGALPTQTVEKLFIIQGILPKKEIKKKVAKPATVKTTEEA